MVFNFNEKSAFLLFFFLHTLIFSLLLFSKGYRNDNKADRWLALFILLCGLYICPFMLGYAGWYSGGVYRDILFYIPFQQVLVIPPLLYIYTCSLLDKSYQFTRKELLHFVPGILYLAYSLIVFATDKIVAGEIVFYTNGKDKDFDTWYQVTGFASLAAYVGASLRLYGSYKRSSFETLSFADAVQFQWAKRFLVGLVLLLLLRALFFITNPEWAQFGRKFWYYISFSVLTYFLSIAGYVNSIRSSVSLRRIVRQDEEHEYEPQPIALATPDDEPNGAANAEESRAYPEEIAQWKTRIDSLMTEQQLFKNPTLTVSDLARPLGTHSKRISQVVHLAYEMNFNDFVNRQRVQEVIEKMHAGEHNLQTLLGLALDCGFNSKSTFNRAFKKATGFTPKDYLQQMVLKKGSDPDLHPSSATA